MQKTKKLRFSKGELVGYRLSDPHGDLVIDSGIGIVVATHIDQPMPGSDFYKVYIAHEQQTYWIEARDVFHIDMWKKHQQTMKDKDINNNHNNNNNNQTNLQGEE